VNDEKKTILLLGATFSTDNMGVGALTAGALKVLMRRYPDASPCFLDYGVVSTVSTIEVEGKTVSVPLINLRFSWRVFLPNNVAYLLVLSVLIKFVRRHSWKTLIQKNRWLKAICEADIAVAVSGGDSFSDIYGLGRFFYVSLPQLLVIILGKKLFLLPQTIGPFKARFSSSVASFLMRRAEVIYSRDLAGIGQVRALLKLKDEDPKVRFCYDMGFVVEPHRPKYLDLGGAEESSLSRRPLIGLNISGLMLIGGYDRGNMFQLKVDYSELVRRIISFLIEVKKANILLIPHVFGNQEESDTIATDVIYEGLKDKYPDSLFRACGRYDQNEIKYIIGLCEFFIGSRMHACIAALSQSIPAVGIAYSDKFFGVFQTVGAGQLVADPRRLTIEETLSLVDYAFAEREAIKSHLQKTMPEVREKVLNVLEDV
jgi:colanic acid/amylovoran biosynthesis protein